MTLCWSASFRTAYVCFFVLRHKVKKSFIISNYLIWFLPSVALDLTWVRVKKIWWDEAQCRKFSPVSRVFSQAQNLSAWGGSGKENEQVFSPKVCQRHPIRLLSLQPNPRWQSSSSKLPPPCDIVVRGVRCDALNATLLLKVKEGLCCCCICWILNYQVYFF